LLIAGGQQPEAFSAALHPPKNVAKKF